jgi:hypothetical protein
VADADDRAGQVVIRKANGLEHGPRGGSIRTVDEDAAAGARVVDRLVAHEVAECSGRHKARRTHAFR